MERFFSLLSWRLFTAQHVSGVFPPIIRRSMTAVAASGFTFVSWWQSCCVRGRAGAIFREIILSPSGRTEEKCENFDLWHLNVGFILPSYRMKFLRAINIYYIVRRKNVWCCALFSGNPIPNRSSCEAVKKTLACLFLHPVIHRLYLHLNCLIVIVKSWDSGLRIIREIIFHNCVTFLPFIDLQISIFSSLNLIRNFSRLMVNICLLNP